MKRVALLSCLAALMVACSDLPSAPVSPLPQTRLTTRWSLPAPSIFGYTTLAGDLLLGPGKIKAIDLRKRALAFTLTPTTYPDRTSYATLGDLIVAVTNVQEDTLTVFNHAGQIVNTVPLFGGTHGAIHQVGPVVVGSSLYVVSGATLYKYNTADLLNPAAQPLRSQSFPGYSLASLVVQDEDHVYVSTNADTSRQIVALDGQGQQRWTVEVAPLDQPISSAFILGVYKDTIIAQAGAAGLQAYKLSTGERAWTDFPDVNICPGGRASIAFRMTIAADMVFLGPWGGTCVLAFHADTGRLAWVFDSPNHITFDTVPLYLNGVVYAANSSLWALDAETGEVLAAGSDDLGDNLGSPLTYDPVENQILHWGTTGLHAYAPWK